MPLRYRSADKRRTPSEARTQAFCDEVREFFNIRPFTGTARGIEILGTYYRANRCNGIIAQPKAEVGFAAGGPFGVHVRQCYERIGCHLSFGFRSACLWER